MSDLKVVQSNDFIQHINWNYKATELKLLKGLIAHIDTINPPKDNKIIIDKSELIDLLNIEDNETYFKKALKSLHQPVTMRDDEEDYETLNIVEHSDWKKKKQLIEITFSKSAMPYLINLKEKFLQYRADVLPYFHTKAGLILFENLLSRERQYGGGIHEISMKELRFITNTENKYDEFKDFNKRVLKAAKDDINQSGCEILIDYKKITLGRKVKSIVFYVTERTTYKEKTYDEAIHNKQMKEQQ